MRRKRTLCILFSLLVPALNLVNNDVFTRGIDYRKVLTSWVIGFCFLLLTWTVNQALRDRGAKWWAYVVANALLILAMQPLLQWLGPYRASAPAPVWMVVMRLAIAILLELLVQSALKALETKDAIALYNQQLLNENLQARLDALREQVNPHFLFNSLGTLRSMVRPDNPAAEQFILHLSDVYRQLLTRKDGATVTLSEELEFLKSYQYMLEARFEGMLTITIGVPEACRDKRLPSFSLQLLVENCIKHNVVSADHPLKVTINADENAVTVSNRRCPKTTGESSGMGLANLRKRYEYLGVPEGIKIADEPDTFVVSLTFVR
ncbi:MAG TPA: histidine kinase [Dinghuibacter sp.]|uniref:sensor histidine kinase n=1 Tax=Dinghuibacter sp. TaxID=2024697 RepID=UPI002C7B88D7|nr:histidine kinase [Dinghuibacter sp.]HTJ11351.1 histidine kinase [Dinghuibacter sp.]